jgi:hypothetical protein
MRNLVKIMVFLSCVALVFSLITKGCRALDEQARESELERRVAEVENFDPNLLPFKKRTILNLGPENPISKWLPTEGRDFVITYDGRIYVHAELREDGGTYRHPSQRMEPDSDFVDLNHREVSHVGFSLAPSEKSAQIIITLQ